MAGTGSRAEVGLAAAQATGRYPPFLLAMVAAPKCSQCGMRPESGAIKRARFPVPMVMLGDGCDRVGKLAGVAGGGGLGS